MKIEKIILSLFIASVIYSCNTIRFSSKNKTIEYHTDTTKVTISYGKKMYDYYMNKPKKDTFLGLDIVSGSAYALELKQVLIENLKTKKGVFEFYLIENLNLNYEKIDTTLFFSAPTLNGKLHGLGKIYAKEYPLGEMARIWYHKGKKDGIEMYYREDGSFSSVKLYKKGKLKINYDVSPPRE